MSAVRLLYSDGRVPLSPTTSELLLVVPACEDMSRYCRLVRYCRAGGSDDDRPLLLRSMYCSAVSADMLDGNEPVKRLPIRCRPLFTQSNIPYAGSEKRISERACVKVPTDASGARLSAAQGSESTPNPAEVRPIDIAALHKQTGPTIISICGSCMVDHSAVQSARAQWPYKFREAQA